MGVHLDPSGSGGNVQGGGNQGGSIDFREWLNQYQNWVQNNGNNNVGGPVNTKGSTTVNDTYSTTQSEWAEYLITDPNDPNLPPPPGGNNNIPGGPNGTGNPWLSPNPIAAFTRILLEILKIQSEQKKEEGLLQAELTEKGFETALSRAEAIIARGHEEANEQYVQAAVAFANAAVALGTASASYGALKTAERDVSAETNRYDSNPKFNELDGSQPNAAAPANTNRMRQWAQKQNDLDQAKTDLQTARSVHPPDQNRISTLEKRVAKLEQEEAAIRPGVRDIEAYEAENPPTGAPPYPDRFEGNPPQNITQLKARQQSILTDRQNRHAELVANRQQQLTSFYTALNQGLSGIFSGIGNLVTAPIKIEIAEWQALIEILQEGSNIIRNAYSGAGEAKTAANDLFSTIVQALERWQAAETQNFGFSGGRAHG